VAALAGAGALGLGAAAGLATVGVRRWRRLRPLPKEPESEVIVSGGFAEAQLTPEFARHLQGSGQFEPGAAVAAHVQRLLDEFNLDSVRIVAMRHGRSSTTLSLSAGLADQPLLLDLAPEFAKRLEAEAEAWTSNDQDVLLRFCRLRKSRLLPGLDG